MKTLCLALVLLPLFATAGDEATKKRDFKKIVVVQGTIVCLGCELEKDGADAQCTLNAKHAQGFKDADGKLWSIVDNMRGHGVITNEKLRGKEVKLHAWKFEKAQYLEVWQYEVKSGDKWEIYSCCADCGWEKGDSGENEMCEDCTEKGK